MFNVTVLTERNNIELKKKLGPFLHQIPLDYSVKDFLKTDGSMNDDALVIHEGNIMRSIVYG